FEIEGDHLLRAPVGEPQAVLVPAGLLAEDDAGHQDAWFRHGRLLSRPCAWRFTDGREATSPAQPRYENRERLVSREELDATGETSVCRAYLTISTSKATSKLSTLVRLPRTLSGISLPICSN